MRASSRCLAGSWIPNDFHYYNTQAAKRRFEPAGYNYSPSMAPHNDPLPEERVRGGEGHGKGWVKLLRRQ